VPGRAIKHEVTDNRQVNDLQEAISSATQVVRDSPMGDGNQRSGLTFPFDTHLSPSFEHDSGLVEVILVDHGLGRLPNGFIVDDLQLSSTDVTVLHPIARLTGDLLTAFVGYRVNEAKQVALVCSTPCVASVWFW